MRHFYALAMCLALALASLAPAFALEVISVPDDVNAVNLSDVLDIRPGDGGRVELSTAAGADGIIRRIEVLASEKGTDPAFALFALRKNRPPAQALRPR